MRQADTLDGTTESAVLDAIRSDPNDVVHRLQRLNTCVRPVKGVDQTG